MHLLDKNDPEDNNEAHVIKHSPYYGETEFSKLLVLKGTDHVGTFMSLKCVVYYANYRSGNQSSKIQVVP